MGRHGRRRHRRLRRGRSGARRWCGGVLLGAGQSEALDRRRAQLHRVRALKRRCTLKRTGQTLLVTYFSCVPAIHCAASQREWTAVNDSVPLSDRPGIDRERYCADLMHQSMVAVLVVWRQWSEIAISPPAPLRNAKPHRYVCRRVPHHGTSLGAPTRLDLVGLVFIVYRVFWSLPVPHPRPDWTVSTLKGKRSFLHKQSQKPNCKPTSKITSFPRAQLHHIPQHTHRSDTRSRAQKRRTLFWNCRRRRISLADSSQNESQCFSRSALVRFAAAVLVRRRRRPIVDAGDRNSSSAADAEERGRCGHVGDNSGRDDDGILIRGLSLNASSKANANTSRHSRSGGTRPRRSFRTIVGDIFGLFRTLVDQVGPSGRRARRPRCTSPLAAPRVAVAGATQCRAGGVSRSGRRGYRQPTSREPRATQLARGSTGSAARTGTGRDRRPVLVATPFKVAPTAQTTKWRRIASPAEESTASTTTTASATATATGATTTAVVESTDSSRVVRPEI